MIKSLTLIAIPIFILVAIFSMSGEEVENTDIKPISSKEEVSNILSIALRPQNMVQGEPVLIYVNGATSTSQVTSITLSSTPLYIFMQDGAPSALVGIDLRKAPGSYPIVLTLSDGTILKKSLVVEKRIAPVVPVGIPDKLGGNTPKAERELVNTLIEEANIINAVPRSVEKIWEGKFRFPLDSVDVADIYGYTRITGSSTLSHKGVDLVADIGTPVYAMNKGVVRFTNFLRNYGHTVILDHGVRVQSVYMHLNEISVNDGETVEKGALIGYSGDTGYVLGPHLHLSLRIAGASIDPMKFMELFGE